MYCYKCGQKIRDDSRYCAACGAKITESEECESRELMTSDVAGKKDISNSEDVKKSTVAQVEIGFVIQNLQVNL